MQTNFSAAQLADPATARSNRILRTCVHCGFCTATCPTYQVLGDELDSPRGRIYLIKDMLEAGRPADEKTVKHIDRCLSCLACMTTCPSGVHYMHLVDHARDYIERTYRRPLPERALRAALAAVLPYPGRFRLALRAAALGRPFAGLMPERLRAMLAMAPRRLPPPDGLDGPPGVPGRGRAAAAGGAAGRLRPAGARPGDQRRDDPAPDPARLRGGGRRGRRLLRGADPPHGQGARRATPSAAQNIRAWIAEADGAGLDAIVINTSGCGTTVKDYGHMFEGEPLAAEAARVAGLARDVSELMAEIGLRPPVEGLPRLRVGYHAACSLQHGQQVRDEPKALLKAAGFAVVEPRDSHLCCGSAGTYNLMQPAIANELRRAQGGDARGARRRR